MPTTLKRQDFGSSTSLIELSKVQLACCSKYNKKLYICNHLKNDQLTAIFIIEKLININNKVTFLNIEVPNSFEQAIKLYNEIC